MLDPGQLLCRQGAYNPFLLLFLIFTHVVATENPSACWPPVAIAVVSGNLKVLERRACLEHLTVPTLHLTLAGKVSTVLTYCPQDRCTHPAEGPAACSEAPEPGKGPRPRCVDSYSPIQLSSYSLSPASFPGTFVGII